MPVTPSNSYPRDDAVPLVSPEVVQPDLTFEDRLNSFWRTYGSVVIVICVAGFLAIIGYGAWQYFAAQRDLAAQKEYAAATTDDKLTAFAAAHEQHMLGAAANVRLGDTAAAAGKYDVAIADYTKAMGTLKSSPLASRVRLGLAMTKILAGKNPEGTAELKKIADDSSEFKVIRAEAIFHLATMASDSGAFAEVQKYTTQLTQVEPQSPWLQRLLALQPPASATPPVTLTPLPVITAPASGATTAKD